MEDRITMDYRISALCKKKGYIKRYIPFLCAPLGIRTLDPLIKSQLLYQLS